MEFLDFIASLAPEGETALVVRQKPQLKDGELQYHADGAIKATWPAQLPEKPRKKGGSYYGNTASFIIDRFEAGRVSASAANCEYVLVMVLDDVGDAEKAPKMPPVPPTWIMETSPGSFQWGYAFSDQPTKGEYSAAIRAIADAGYSDPGATNPVRNFRLPGSVNLKPGKDNFEARLVEFHPDREYTLAEIVAAFGVTPAEGADPFRPIRISDDGTDDVLAWLSNQGLVLRRPNLEGWAGIVCPNSAEHTDGNPEGRYLPTSRAFVCYHSHCIDFDSKAFLEWVEAQGGPAHNPGLRDELLAMRMSEALSRLNPTEAFPDAAAAVVAEVERKELGRIEKESWWERFAYIQDDDAYFDLQDRRELSRGTFNALFRHIDCKSINNAKRKIEASVCFDENRQAKGARALVGITYAPGESILCARDGLVYGNRWRDARPEVASGVDPTPWLQHAERMIPNAEEREHVLNVMAFKVQNPNRKINHAVLHGGNPGSGKDTLWAPFFWAIGGDTLTNVKKLDNKDLSTPWGYHLESEVLIINELRQPEASDRRALENSLKPVIAAPPEYLTVQRKGLHPIEAVNRLQVVAFSNERMAISIPSNDRRWFVIWSDATRMDDEASAKLWAWYVSGGMAAVAAWLYDRDVSAFNPGAAPPMTEAKAIMIETGMSSAESFLTEMMRARLGEFSTGVLGGPWQAVCDRLTGMAPAGMKLPVAALLHAFREAGWVDMGLLKSRNHSTKKHIFCAPNMVNRTKTELRDMVELPPQPLMVRVK